MPRIKLTKPSFANLSGQLPGKNFRGVNFVNGISDEIPLAVVDKIAAQIGGDLVDENGEVTGPAGSDYRRTTIIPTPVVPRSESTFPVDGSSLVERLEAVASQVDIDAQAVEAGRAATVAAATEAKTSEENAAASAVAAAASAAEAAQSAADAAASAGGSTE